MTKHEYSVEEVRERAWRSNMSDRTSAMLNAYADLREQIERAREGVTDEVERVAIKAAEVWARENGFVSYMAPTGYLRAALQAVAHLFPSGERGGLVVGDDLIEFEDARALAYQAAEAALRGVAKRDAVTNEWLLELIDRQMPSRAFEPANPPAQAAQVDARNAVMVDRGALRMAMNVLRRAGKDEVCDALEAACAPTAEPVAHHHDDAAVDAFAEALKAKLAEARVKGRSGWQDKDDCPQQRLSDMLRAHVEKGDPRDVANFAMFLHQRGEAILPAEPVAQGEAETVPPSTRIKVCPRCEGRGRTTAHAVPCTQCDGTGEPS